VLLCTIITIQSILNKVLFIRIQSQPLEVYIILPMSCGIFAQTDILNQYYSPVEELGYLYFMFGSHTHTLMEPCSNRCLIYVIYKIVFGTDTVADYFACRYER